MYYIGYHRCKVPNDAYLGSGTYFRRAVTKHGKESFTKEVLFVFDNEVDALLKEAELVDEVLGDPHCYNLAAGGAGGFSYINANREPLSAEERAEIGERAKALWRDPEFRASFITALKHRWEDPTYRETMCQLSKDTWRDAAAKEKRIASMRESGARKWTDPIFRAKQMDAAYREGVRKSRSDAHKASWSDPSKRPIKLAGVLRGACVKKGDSATPKRLVALRKAYAQRADDPAWSAAMKLGWERRRARWAAEGKTEKELKALGVFSQLSKKTLTQG